MAPETLTEYERRRMENIRRNGEVMASLKLRRIASDLSSSSAQQSMATTKKRPCPSPAPRSPSSSAAPSAPAASPRIDLHPPPPIPLLPAQSRLRRPEEDRPLPHRRYPCRGLRVGRSRPDRRDLGASKASESDHVKGRGSGFDPRRSMALREEKVRKVLRERILAVRFLPFGDRTVIAAGNKLGHLGFWDVDYSGGMGMEMGCLYIFLIELQFRGFRSIRIRRQSCYDGFICLMDADSETFNMIYSCGYSIYSLCQAPHDNTSLYFGEGGELKLFDLRVGKVSGSWDLHEQRINTIDFHPENANLFATSSTDGTACIWDLRRSKENKLECLKTVQHNRAVHSAHFSPSGSCLATTSRDDKVGIISGANFEDLFMIKHNNQTGRWLSTFRAIWGWDDSYLYLGNMRRAVDVISVADRTTTALESEHMTSIPCRFAAHPYNVGSLACATAGGKVFLWTKS
uniref:Uncharacterized protein n=1 Tax=Ananas comosus var. bracteatus TaxID=296719 RepID=A0A6V7PM29_ANACO|nr:unnamed protein product [Ananas comosus var. bracteatus]